MGFKTAWLGLGVMGFPMAGYLATKGGHQVAVYNRSPDKADKWLDQYQGSRAATPREAANDADFVFACVGNDDDLRSVVLGPDGAFSGMKKGAIFVDHTTASADVARELSKAAKSAGLGFVDAPVSGGQAGAENGVLTVMCGGAEEDYQKAEPMIANYAKMCRLLGPSGSGQLAKMCNQIAIAGLVQSLAESLHFGEKAGLDMTAVIDVISKGAAGSWQMDNRHQTMLDDKFDYGFAVDWMRKDLGICLDEARRNGAQIPVCALVDQFYAQVQKAGGGRFDTSSLLKLLK